MKYRLAVDHSNETISWTFNDFVLGFLMIVLMMASMFAFFSNAVVVDSFINQCEDPSEPNCGEGNTLFGGRQKGKASEKVVLHETATEAEKSQQQSVQQWSGLGNIGGNSEVRYGTATLNPQKQNVVFEIFPDGAIQYRGELLEMEAMRKILNTMAIERGVFLEAIVHEGTPFEVYKEVRYQLWDLADAEHWRDIVLTSDNKDAIEKAIAEYGTTFVDQAEDPVVLEGAAGEDGERTLFSDDFLPLEEE